MCQNHPQNTRRGRRIDAAIHPVYAARTARNHLSIDRRGFANLARQVRSPNFDARPPGTTLSLIVIHGISLPPGEFGGTGIARLFTNRVETSAHPYFATIAHLRVSTHFLISRAGALVQFVSCADRAWHAGESSWRGRDRCNDYSIGIELEGTDDFPYAPAQYAILARVVKALSSHYPIEDVVGHCDIAPGRKTDPGTAFDWPRLRRLASLQGR